MTTKPVFEFLTPKTVILTDVNLRKELHGEDLVQAVDLTMAVDLPNSVLDTIQPGLRQALYFNASEESGQDQLEGMDKALPNLRFPHLNACKFALDDKKNKLAGYDLGVDYGLGDEISSMYFDCCKVTRRAIEVREGGTMRLSWQVQYSGDRLDVATCGKLASLERGEISIVLIPPAVPVPDEPEQPMDNPFPVQGGEEKPKTIEDLFIEGGKHLQEGVEGPGAGSSDDAGGQPAQDRSPF
jgi:hypothetical protein